MLHLNYMVENWEKAKSLGLDCSNIDSVDKRSKSTLIPNLKGYNTQKFTNFIRQINIEYGNDETFICILFLKKKIRIFNIYDIEDCMYYMKTNDVEYATTVFAGSLWMFYHINNLRKVYSSGNFVSLEGSNFNDGVSQVNSWLKWIETSRKRDFYYTDIFN